MGRSDTDNAEAHNAELVAKPDDDVTNLALVGFDRGYRLGLKHAIEYVDTLDAAIASRMREMFRKLGGTE